MGLQLYSVLSDLADERASADAKLLSGMRTVALPALQRADDRAFLNVTQCVNGGVHTTLYNTGNRLAQAGVLSGHDITSEAAITKMMYLFGMGLPPENVKKYLNYSLCGEVTL